MKVCLAGNPNSGKTTLFNSLTGSTAHVGNWPGVTVDKKTGVYKKGGKKIDIVDLPGIYSLSPYTPEEVVSRDFLLNEKPDAIINIVDATNLERNLYLTTQLLELDIPVVIALNMSDILRKSKDKLDVAGLQEAIGVPVVEVSALKGENIPALMDAVSAVSGGKRKGFSVMSASPYKTLYEFALDGYEKAETENASFRAVKLIEDDEKEVAASPGLHKKILTEKKKFESADFDGDYEGVVADARYRYITGHFSKFLSRGSDAYAVTKSDKIDKVLTHRIFGIPIFLGIMFAVFHIIFSENFLFLGVFFSEGSFDNIFGSDAINSPGVILFNLMEWGTSSLGGLVAGWLNSSPEWVGSLINDGVLGGLFAVLSFVPQIMLLFFFLSLLEDSGYMARVAFIMDRAFRKFGLSGKAFLPMLMCFGCAVPGIMATKTLENEKERDRTIFLTPFFSCGAKMPIWATFAALMFGGAHGDLIVFSIYFLGIAIAIIAAIFLNKTFLKGETPPFIMELPSYHSPQARNLFIHLWEKLKHYIVRAGTIILGALIVIWFLSSFGFSAGTFGYVENIENSILAYVGKGLRYIFYPIGFGMGEYGWMLVVAAFTGLIAKEMVPATMAALLGMSELTEELAGTPFDSMVNSVPAAVIYAFMAFNLLAVPCMAAVAAARGELKSRKRFWQAIAFWMATAYLVSGVLYWSISYWWIGVIIALIIAALITVKLVFLKKRAKIQV